MAFVNEEIPTEDEKKYRIDEINKEFLMPPGDSSWTMDRDRDIYLRWMEADREEPSEQQVSFYWKGGRFIIDLKRDEEGKYGGKGSTTWSWNGMYPPENPKGQAILDNHLEEIVTDLKEALKTYKDGGIYSTIADHTAYFDF